MWIFLGNEEVGERADGEGKLARRRNKKARDFTHFLIHKSTLLSSSHIEEVSLQSTTISGDCAAQSCASVSGGGGRGVVGRAHRREQ